MLRRKFVGNSLEIRWKFVGCLWQNVLPQFFATKNLRGKFVRNSLGIRWEFVGNSLGLCWIFINDYTPSSPTALCRNFFFIQFSRVVFPTMS